MRRLTLEVMAVRLGLSSQQIQKYESGATRISAARLVEIARVLDVAITSLLDDVERNDGVAEPCSAEPIPSAIDKMAVNDTAEPRHSEPLAIDVLELVQAFCATRNVEARTRVLEMAKFLARLEHE